MTDENLNGSLFGSADLNSIEPFDENAPFISNVPPPAEYRLVKDGSSQGGAARFERVHQCAKCGTGYATAECDRAAAEAILNAKPGGIVRVGPDGGAGFKRILGSAKQESDENVIRELLYSVIGEDATREGLRETPKRVVKAWKHWTSGYHVDIAGLLKVFEDGAEGYDEMVVRKNIRIYSHCEHHLAPIIGECTIAYIPDGMVVGLSKLDRLADAFARRLQVQERLTSQIADALMEHLKPKGVGVHINARHMCIESRGVAQHSSDTLTSALRGVFKDQPETRAEFMALAKS
jgi:GTP cyclohydrolase I